MLQTSARTIIFICLTTIAMLASACSTSPRSTSQKPTTNTSPASNPSTKLDSTSPSTLIARYTSTPIKIDGKLDEPIWQSTPVYAMHLAPKAHLPGYPLQETTLVRLAWDDKFFYVAGQFQDADVVDNATQDQQFLYSMADTMELFLKPADRRWYWEFYGTPRAHKASLFYLSRGRFGLSPWPYQPNSGHKVAATIQGTLNDPTDRDQGYIIEMAIPRKLLSRDKQYLHADNDDKQDKNDKQANASDENSNNQAAQPAHWLILVARYNYSAYSETFQAELSCIPQIIRTNFHLYEQWATLKLER